MNNWKWKLVLCILTGILVPLCGEPFNLSFFAFIAFVPLLFVLESERSFWRILLYSWLAMFFQNMITFEWVHFVAREFGELSWTAALFVLLAYALLTTFSLQIFAVLYYLARRYFKKNVGLVFYLLLIPSIFIVSEVLDPKIFKWFLGDALTTYKYMVQFADVFGASGLSFLILVVNVAAFLIVKGYLKERKFSKKAIVPGTLCILIPLFLLIYGVASYSVLKKVQAKCPVVRAGVVQANIGNPMKLTIGETLKLKAELGNDTTAYVSERDLILKKYRNMTYDILGSNKDIDLIVWPETAFPDYYIDNSNAVIEHKKMVASVGMPFLFGGYYLDRGNRYYNSAIMVTPGGQVSLYHKNMLLPFGEFMPLSEYFPALKNAVPAVSDFARGKGPEVFKLAVKGLELRLAPAICYEVINTGYVRKMIDMDANVILNLSNDSWFGVVEPYLHLRVTRMRAVEYRRPIIRSTNTGITSLIDITGDVVVKSELGKEQNVVMDVPICDHRMRSFYSLAGRYFVLLAAIGSIAIVMWSRKKRSR